MQLFSTCGSGKTPASATRVAQHTPDEINAEIQAQMIRNVKRYESADAGTIQRRLRELDHEWDIERMLEANAASLSLIGLGLGRLLDQRFYALPAVVAGFLLQHAVQGWYPPVSVFRRMGIRTRYEIDQERYALKAIRGDFQSVSSPGPSSYRDVKTEEAIAAVRA